MKQGTKKYGIVGVAGYVAKKHIEAIYATGGEVVQACDVTENVGFLDNYSKDINFSKDYSKILQDDKVETVVVCAPNYLHYVMASRALTADKNVILEKPCCLNVNQVDKLIEQEKASNKKVNVIMQSRYNSNVANIEKPTPGSLLKIVYHAPRGNWYSATWKSDYEKSGGILFNIGIHFIDIVTNNLGRISGDVDTTNSATDSSTSWGSFKCGSRGEYSVEYEVSVDSVFYPERTIHVFDNELCTQNIIDLSSSFGTNHLRSYKEILNGNGISLDSARPGIEAAQLLSESCRNLPVWT